MSLGTTSRPLHCSTWTTNCDLFHSTCCICLVSVCAAEWPACRVSAVMLIRGWKTMNHKNGSINDLSYFACHSDEMYELLSKLPESVAYTCTKCTERHPAEWRTALERELQGCVRHILTALLNSRTSSHLLRYRQVRYTYCCFFLSGFSVQIAVINFHITHI